MEDTIEIVDIDELKQAVDAVSADATHDSWHGIDLYIKHTLSLSEVLQFVSYVVSVCFNDDNIYMPEVKDFAIKHCILEMYTNIRLPESVAESYSMIYNSDLTEFVIEHINQGQLNEIVAAIDQKLHHLAYQKVERIHQHMDAVYNAFDNLQNQVSDLFSGVTPDDMQNLVSIINTGRAEKALVDVENSIAGADA